MKFIIHSLTPILIPILFLSPGLLKDVDEIVQGKIKVDLHFPVLLLETKPNLEGLILYGWLDYFVQVPVIVCEDYLAIGTAVLLDRALNAHGYSTPCGMPANIQKAKEVIGTAIEVRLDFSIKPHLSI